LRDDIVSFTNRLTKLDKKCKLFELKYFPHGFLNYDVPHMMPEAKIGNDIIIEEMEKVFSSTNQ
jgi:acetyl esterase/lipase